MKYIIRWNTGYGDNVEVVEADTLEEAEVIAYESWYEDVQSHADYEAFEYSEEALEKFE